MPRRLLVAAVAVVTTAVVVAGCGGRRAGPAPSATSPTSAPSASAAPLAVPARGAYLGAWLNTGGSGGSVTTELADLPALGSTPAILGLYSGWSAPAPVQALQRIAATGAVPLLAWGCTSTAAITSGADDDQITAYATALRSVGRPVLLRWFWEMDLRTPAHATCLGSAGPQGFVAAWTHVRSLFRQAGATNVSFVWCPGVAAGVDRMAAFFPGADAVDWVGADGYANVSGDDVGSVFGPWYQRFSGQGKPMLIAETGAHPGAQAAYLASIGAQLPTRFPAVRAVAYFDAVGDRGSWVLDAAGLAAFATLARDPYFQVRAGPAAPTE